MTAPRSDRHHEIRALFEAYIEMYASRDDRLTAHFSENFSGYTGSGNFLVRSREEWIKITRQDFAQVTGRIRIEMLDLALQDISDDVVASTAFFHIHLPTENEMLSSEVARLVLIFRREGADWKIVHSGISIPYHPAQDGEVYPLKSLQEKNSALTALVEERTRALHRSEALYRQLTEDTQDVLWKADADLRITYISPADERLRGYKADEVVGRHVFEMFNDDGIARVKSLMQQRAAAEKSGPPFGSMTFEAEHRCKDGRWIWGEVQSNPDRDAEGKIIGYHGITREVTQRKHLEEQVRQLAFHDPLTRLAARYLASAKRGGQEDGPPYDPVSRFHLGNGARIEHLNYLADTSAKGFAQSFGLMVNYRYQLEDLEGNLEAFASNGRIAMSSAIRRLVRAQ